MRMSASCARARIVGFFATIIMSAALFLPSASHAAESISVVVDQAKLIKLPDRVATIVVGNPLIADVVLQPGGTMVVTGKGYGTTNVVALDRAGAVLIDRTVQVEGTTDKLVTVYKGIERESYSCTPICQRRTTLGDSATYFAATMGQTGALSAQASGVAAEAK